MKDKPETSILSIMSAVILGWLGWVSITIIDLDKKVAVLNDRVLGVAIAVHGTIHATKPPIYARFGFLVPDVTPSKKD